MAPSAHSRFARISLSMQHEGDEAVPVAQVVRVGLVDEAARFFQGEPLDTKNAGEKGPGTWRPSYSDHQLLFNTHGPGCRDRALSGCGKGPVTNSVMRAVSGAGPSKATRSK